MSIERELIAGMKDVINRGSDMDTFTSMYEYYTDLEYDREVDWPYILQKTYIHACLKRREDIAGWLEELFGKLDPISHIAYRQTLAYGHTILRRK